MQSRVLAIGDIHGCRAALETLAELVPFRGTDRLIGLGDYVDRGPDSAAVLDWLIDRQESGQLVALRGNHELMMLDAARNPVARDGWESVGGRETLESYQRYGNSNGPLGVPETHWRFLNDQTLPYYETTTHLFVHANALPEIPISQQPDAMLYWERWNCPPRHMSGKILVCGHSGLRSGRPAGNADSICIDTAVYRNSGWLTCLDVDSGEYWQANQQRAFRTGWIADCEFP